MDEQIDLINEQNQVIGKSGKFAAHRDGLLHRIVIGELVNSKGEYCFVRQASDRQDAGQFVSPVGGHVGAGETVEAALNRESQEECGITPTNFQFIAQTIYNREVIGRKENHLFLIYLINTDQNPTLNHESTEFRYFTKDQIKQAIATNDPTFGAAWHHVFKNCILK